MRPQTALQALEQFIHAQAPKHHISPNAPDTFAELKAWRDEGNILGVDSLPVSGDHCEQTIYRDRATNVAFRAWHDAIHLAHDYGTDFEGEIATASEHARRVLDSLGVFADEAAAIITADTAGQSIYHNRHGRFPTDQRKFVREFVAGGERRGAVLANATL
ncbi:MAG: hypothetical protein AAF628_08270 [Planctomycetota bacterium]